MNSNQQQNMGSGAHQTYGSAALQNSNQKYQGNQLVIDGQNINYNDPTNLDQLLSFDKVMERKNQLYSKNDQQKEAVSQLQSNGNQQKHSSGTKKKGVYEKFVDKLYEKIFGVDNKENEHTRPHAPANQPPGNSQQQPSHLQTESGIQSGTPDASQPMTQAVLQQPALQYQPHEQIQTHQVPAQPLVFNTTRELLSIEEISVQDKIAPSALEVDFNDIKINDTYVRTIFVIDYKKASPGMLESLINYEEPIDISMYYYPIDTNEIIDKIRRKIAELEAALNMDLEAGKVPNAKQKVALQDALRQQDALAAGTEKYFHFALYITIKAKSIEKLNNMTSVVVSDLSSKEMTSKVPTLKMENAFKSTLPYGYDRVRQTRNMDTTSIAMTFPFTSSDLSQEKGVLYGINTYNRGLIVFDRFSMPNANMLVLASSGGGKSYFVKLEIIRSLMTGTECIVIDPENEYEDLCRTLGGSYISFSQDGKSKLNPFELPAGADSREDELRLKELSLQGFFKILFGTLGTRETAILDRAVRMAYREKGVTNDPATFVNDPPRIEDLYKVLRAMEDREAHEMAMRLERFLVGAAAGIFDKRTNIEINNSLTVFSIRDLSEELRPLAMYLMIDYIWTRIKREKKRRILAIDEAWLLMKYPDSALFINSIAKRARKYYLGLTTIIQDVQDFLSTDYGRAIVTNSAIQVLFRQSSAAVGNLGSTFNLSEGEKAYLLSVPPGNGLFFAGNNHVSIHVKASPSEHTLVTTNPIEIEKLKREGKL
ncbi:MAG: VirB4-like conjugal transfer ATPase, CD1110 family [Candidatus Dojkabacteria bacterium]